MQQPESFPTERNIEKAYTSDVAARSIQIGDKAGGYRVFPAAEDDRYSFCGGHDCCHRAVVGNDDCNLAADQIGCQRRKPVRLIIAVAILDTDVAAFRVTGLAQAAMERSKQMAEASLRAAAEKSDHRHRLLRARDKRHRNSSAAKSRDEVPPPCMSQKEHCEG